MTASGTWPDRPIEPVLAPTDVKRQHYVSQFYLRRFTDPSGQLQTTDLQTGTSKLSGPRAEAMAIGFNNFELDGHVVSTEGWLGEVEAAAAPVLLSLANDPSCLLELPEADELAFARFLAAFRFRIPTFRTQVERTRAGMVNHARAIMENVVRNR